MSLNIKIDIGSITEEFKEVEKQLEAALKEGVKSLAYQAHAHILEKVKQELHSRREQFEEGLQMVEKDREWSIVVPQKILWIEEGQDPYSMLEGLLSSPKAKMSKDGHRYIVVPFQHNKGATVQPNAFSHSVTEMLKNNLKKMKIPYQKLETGPDGKPKLGHGEVDLASGGKIHNNIKLHSINMGGPQRPHWASPVLDGVTIYQNQHRRPDGKMVTTERGPNKGQPKVHRDVMTFRTASDNPDAMSKWEHPGNEGKRFLDEAYTWSINHWETVVLPEIIKKITGKSM